jgi:enoyl-CoA hydratase/carnithine racemase
MAKHVSNRRDKHNATVTLERPDRRNALSDELLADLIAAFTELRDDAESRVVSSRARRPSSRRARTRR